ncbi:hypothetical protein [Desulfovulcanus sp.]
MRSLGPGLSLAQSLHLGTEKGDKIFLQTSTGDVEQPDLLIKIYIQVKQVGKRVALK